MVIGNCIIAIAAIEGDVLNRVTHKGVAVDGIIPLSTGESDRNDITIFSSAREGVVANGVIARATIKSDGEYILIGVEGIVADGVIT